VQRGDLPAGLQKKTPYPNTPQNDILHNNYLDNQDGISTGAQAPVTPPQRLYEEPLSNFCLNFIVGEISAKLYTFVYKDVPARVE
jgi:hypothetical protein